MDRVTALRRWLEGHWTLYVLGMAAFVLLARVAMVAAGFGASADLRIYYYFSHFVHEGVNPYFVEPLASAGGGTADEPIAEFLLYAALFSIWDSPEVIRLFFAVLETGTVLLLGFAVPRSLAWRANMVAFYALNPLVFLAWGYLPHDKTLSFFLITLIVVAVERARYALGWAATATLAALKWMGAFFALPLLVHTVQRLPIRRALTIVGLAAVFVLVANLPYFPDNLLNYERRAERLAFDPIFDSITVFLAKLGIYDSLIAQAWLPLSLLGIAVLYLRRIIDVTESVALGVFAGFVLLPDQPSDRILLTSLPLLLVIRTTRRRWWLWWALSLVAGFRVFQDNVVGLDNFSGQLAGDYGTVRHLVAANAFMVGLIAMLVADKIRGVGREPVVGGVDEEDLKARPLRLAVPLRGAACVDRSGRADRPERGSR